MRILTEYGFISIFGVLFTSTTQIVSCIMFRVDLNEMFILCGSFYRTDSEKSTADYVDETIQDISILSMMSWNSPFGYVEIRYFGDTSSM